MGIGRVLIALLGEKVSAHVQQSQPMRRIVRETAKIEQRGIAGSTSVVVAATQEIGQDIKMVVAKVAALFQQTSAATEDAGQRMVESPPARVGEHQQQRNAPLSDVPLTSSPSQKK